MNAYLVRILPVVLATLCLAGCMSNSAFRDGRSLVSEGKEELALPRFQQAAAENPANGEYRATYLQLRERLINRWLEQGIKAHRDGNDDEAERLFRQTLEEDPGNARARNSLVDIARDQRHRGLITEAEAAIKHSDHATAMLRIRTILGENPDQARAQELKRLITNKGNQATTQTQLSAALRKPITIEFKDAPLRQIFEVISRTSGLNFVFDKEVKGDQRATIFLRNKTIQDAVNLILLTNQLEQRVLDANSILIFPNTVAKLKDYQALTVRTFFLSNVDAKTAAATLKTIVRTKDIVIDEKQNLITLRDTPDAIRMAERILALHDQPEPEVMLEVAVLEVSRSRLLNLGVQWPDQLSLTALAGSSGNLTLSDIRNITPTTAGATINAMTVNARKTDSATNVLANPRIRARNHETAKIMIGDRIPNITTTTTATGFASQNIQYVDVGLKLEVQPTVYADNEIAIKISLEVSSIVDKITTTTGALAYQIGTRNASTLLRLKDGENQVLAGLIRNEDTSTGARVPGLGDIPLLGRLFGSQRDENNKTEIILSITPRLIRDARRPDFSMAEFDTGTDSMLRIRPEGSDATPADVSGNKPRPGNVAAPAENIEAQLLSAPKSLDPKSSPEFDKPVEPTALMLQGPAQAKIGSSFSVQLTIQPGEPVTSIPLALTYNPKALEVTSISEGEFLKQDKGTTNFSNRVDRNSGQIFATVTRSGQDGATRPGNIVTVGFKALSVTNNASIQITAISPIGLGGRSVNATTPSPLSVAVTP